MDANNIAAAVSSVNQKITNNFVPSFALGVSLFGGNQFR